MKYNRADLTPISVKPIIGKAIIYVMAFLLSGVIKVHALKAASDNETSYETPVKSSKQTSIRKSHKVYFSLADEFGAPKTQGKRRFDCSDQIYTVAQLTNYPKGEYQLTVLWEDPSGSVREKTSYPFNVHNRKTKIWAWLSLSRAAGAGLVQWLDPAAGLEDFIGIWTIDVLIDGKRISKQKIDVSC